VAKRKKKTNRRKLARRWSSNAVPIKGSGPNMAVVAEYQERVKSLRQPYEELNPTPGKIFVEQRRLHQLASFKEMWQSETRQGTSEWYLAKTIVPNVVRWFSGNKHFFVKTFPLGNKKRSKEYTNLEAANLYLLTNRVKWSDE
jgi:hypothetical protein